MCLAVPGCKKEEEPDQPKEALSPGVVCVAPMVEDSDSKIMLTELKLDVVAYTGATPARDLESVSPPHLRKEKKRPPPFMVVPGLKNLALYKLVTASSKPIIGELEQLTDGVKTSGGFDFVEGPNWVQVDLGEPASIHAIVVWYFYMTPVIFDDVIVRISNDVNFSQNVITLFNNDHDNSAGMGKGNDTAFISRWWGEIIDARNTDHTGTTARYVRVNTAASVNGMFSRYVEIAVYGKPNPSVHEK